MGIPFPKTSITEKYELFNAFPAIEMDEKKCYNQISDDQPDINENGGIFMKTAKKLCALLMSVLMVALMLPVAATAQEAGWAECGGFKCWLEPEKGTAVICGRAADNNDETLEIPASFSHEGIDYSVTKIDGSAFRDDAAASVVIAEGIRIIASNAFSGCRNLEAISLPNSLSVIGAAAFRDCSSLAEITLPDALEQIGREAFHNTAFYNTKDNWSAADPDGDGEARDVLYCGDYLLASRNDPETLTVKEGTRLIADYAFYQQSELSAVSISATVERIGNYAFDSCNNLSQVTFGEASHLTYIGQDAFCSDRSLTAIELPAGVKTIEAYTFNHAGLTSIVLPEGLSRSGFQAFDGCGSLREVTIPVSVTEIEMWAFSGCDALEVVHYNGTKAQWDAIEGEGKADIEEKVQFTTPSVSLPPVPAKAANPLQVEAKTPAVKYQTLKKKTQKLVVSKLLKFINKGKGKRSYTLVSAKRGDKNVAKNFLINPKTGKLAIRKGLSKGTYKLRIKVKAAGNAAYSAGKQTVTVKLKVK